MIRILKCLCSESGKPEEEILSFANSAPKRYRVYSIPKRTSGLRTIAHPSKELKFYQRILNLLLEDALPVSRNAFAYRKGLSIKENAERHKNNSYLLKMDFENFFNSITPRLLSKMLSDKGIAFSPGDLSILNNMLFWNPSKKKGGKMVLSVGAPTSPLISNFIMYSFDHDLNEACREKGIVYTRYADDITFSTNTRNSLFDMPELVKSLLESKTYGEISINESKTVFSSKAHNRHVTGITLTNEGSLSIGRDRKRYIYSLIHKFSLSLLTDEDIGHLNGLLSYACHIEDGLKERIKKKYGDDIIRRVRASDKARRG